MNKLSNEEVNEVVAVCNEKQFASLPPSKHQAGTKMKW